jgi:hypothetical protein
MNERQWRRRASRRYPTYQPYPVSGDSDDEIYTDPFNESPGSSPKNDLNMTRERPSVLADDSFLPEWFDSRPIVSIEEKSFRPLSLLQSLFSDRLSFLQRSLEEIEMSRKERECLTETALSELDRDIEECERYLDVLRGILNKREVRQHLERKLMDLKRERRHVKLSNWKDILFLKAQAQKLERELDSIARTGNIQGDSIE